MQIDFAGVTLSNFFGANDTDFNTQEIPRVGQVAIVSGFGITPAGPAYFDTDTVPPSEVAYLQVDRNGNATLVA